MSYHKKNSAKENLDTERRVVKAIEVRSMLYCTHCPPHKGENGRTKSFYGAKKPKYKDHNK